MSPVRSSSAPVSGPSMTTWKYTLTVCGAVKNGETTDGVGRSYWFVTRSLRCRLPAMIAASGPLTIGRTHGAVPDAAGALAAALLPVDAALVAASAPAASAAVRARAAAPFQSDFLIPRPLLSSVFESRTLGDFRGFRYAR